MGGYIGLKKYEKNLADALQAAREGGTHGQS